MDIEKVAQAIEADAGMPLDDLRQALAEMQDGIYARKTEFIPQPDGRIRRLVTLADGSIERDEILNATASARMRSGLSQSRFAELLGVSIRTLQDWEQGRRTPSGAASTLLKVAAKHPDIFLELS